jgi:hypothetical protein
MLADFHVGHRPDDPQAGSEAPAEELVLARREQERGGASVAASAPGISATMSRSVSATAYAAGKKLSVVA